MPIPPLRSVVTSVMPASRPRGRWFGGVAVVMLLAASACSGEVAVAPPPATDLQEFYWALTFDHHAVTLSTVAPYDTLTLTATPRNIDGEPLSGLPTPTFTSTDLERVQVSSEGVVQAIAPGNQIPVIATLAHGNVVHVDTVLVTVTNTASPPVLDSLSFALDSAKVAYPGIQFLAVTAWDTSGAAIFGLPIHYTSSDPTIATISLFGSIVMLQPLQPGQVTIIATTTAYGITKADTVRFTIGQSVSANIAIVQRMDAGGVERNVFVPGQITIGVGGDITWRNQTGIPTDVTFDDPTNILPVDRYCIPFYTEQDPEICESGNIAAFGVPQEVDGVLDPTAFYHNLRARVFSEPGTYTYHSTSSGATGTIVVVDESTP